MPGRASLGAHAAPGTGVALTHNLGFARNTDLESPTNPRATVARNVLRDCGSIPQPPLDFPSPNGAISGQEAKRRFGGQPAAPQRPARATLLLVERGTP